MQTQDKKLTPEITLAFQHYSVTYNVWWTQHNASIDGFSEENVNKVVNKSMPIVKAIREEAAARFVIPNLKDKSQEEISAGIASWCHEWHKFIRSLERDEVDKLSELQEVYHVTGLCPFYQQFKPTDKCRNILSEMVNDDLEFSQPEEVEAVDESGFPQMSLGSFRVSRPLVQKYETKKQCYKRFFTKQITDAQAAALKIASIVDKSNIN